MKSVYDLLGVKPFYNSIRNRQDNIVSLNTKTILKEHSRKLAALTDKMSEMINKPSSQKTPLNFAQVCSEFVSASAGGPARLEQVYDRVRKAKELLFAVFYDFRNDSGFSSGERERTILLNPKLCAMLWELMKKYNRRAVRKAMLYFLTEYWLELPPEVRVSILTNLVLLTKGIDTSRKNKFDEVLGKNIIWVRPDGTAKLAQKLESKDISEVNNFFAEQRDSQHNDSGLPVFIPFEKRKGYCADVLKHLLLAGSTPERLDAYIQLMGQYSTSGYFSRNDVLRLLVAVVVKKPILNYKEELKNIALKKIGDTLDINKWFLWKTASQQDKDDVEAVRMTIENWMREDILSIFFEKLMINEERKNFWLKYVKSMNITQIFCSSRDRATLLNDPRLQNDVSRARLGNSRMGDNQAPVLVMQIGYMVIAEVAVGGNALYIYKRQNLEKHGLIKFAKALNSERTSPFRVDEFKNTSLQRLESSDTGEGRFFHAGGWQYKLSRWLYGNEIYSSDELESTERKKVGEQILDMINAANVDYVDHRDKDGCLWILGGYELSDFVMKCKAIGVDFHFKRGGGRAVGGIDAWWYKTAAGINISDDESQKTYENVMNGQDAWRKRLIWQARRKEYARNLEP